MVIIPFNLPATIFAKEITSKEKAIDITRGDPIGTVTGSAIGTVTGSSEQATFTYDENIVAEEYQALKEKFLNELAPATVANTFPRTVTTNGNTLSNEFIEFAVDSSTGRFTIGTTEGNPDLSTDDYKKLLFGHSNPGTSYTSIYVDGSTSVYGNNGFTISPYFENNSNISEVKHGDIRVKQIISLVKNSSTNRDDIIEVKYEVINEGESSSSFGLRIMMDTMLGNNDAAPFRIPIIGDVTTEMEFVGDDIPQYWQAFDSLSNPNVVSYGNFVSGEIKPSKVQFTNWSRVYNTQWGYQISKGSSNGDSAVSVIWNRYLAPGMKETYTTRYGLSELLQDLKPPLAVTVAADSTVQVEDSSQNYIPYTITTYVQNTGNTPAINAKCIFSLPDELTFQPSESNVIELGNIGVGEIQKVDKVVYVKEKSSSDRYVNYSIKVSADNCAIKVLSKQLVIPKVESDYQIEFNYSCGSSRDFTETCYFSHDYFNNKSTTGYNASLATSSLCFALSCFASNEQEYTNKFANAKDFLTKLDFKDFDKNEWFTKKPQSDSIGVVAANKKIIDNKGEEYTLIACGIRGGGYESEWAGNFTVGRTGNHYGFELARNQVINFLSQYISEKNITGKVKLWITGYSRAAATSNMVAGAIDDGTSLGNSITLEKGDLYAYTFETPQGAWEDNIPYPVTYNNIWNIINRNDPVPRVAMTGLGFSRFGYDRFLPSKSADGRLYEALKDAMLNFYHTMDSYSEVGEYTVDDFEMLEFKLKYILPGGPGGKDFIQVDENTPQDIYLDGLMSKLVKEAIKTRDNYVDDLQNGIRTIFTAMYGTLLPDEPVSRIKEAMNIFIDKLCEWGTVRDMALIVFNPFHKETIEDYITNLLEESFNEAGINYYNIDSLKDFVGEICKIVVPFVVKHPNYTLTTVKNIDKLGAAHYPELCFAWLKAQDINYTNTPIIFDGIGQYRIIRINCPVDLKVYNRNNILVSHFKSDTVQNIPDSYISSYVNQDGEKIICLPANEDFRIEIIPTDNGIMNYSVNEYSSSKDDYTRIVNYYDIPIMEGQILSAYVPAFSEGEFNNSTDGSSTLYSFIDSSGNTIEPNKDLKGDNASNAYYLVSAIPEKEEQGIVIGQGIRNEGAFAQVEAIPNEGYEFIGWYEDGTTLVSEESEYRFCVKHDITLVAKFKYVGTEANNIEVTFNVTSKWDTAFNANITITNISDKVIDNWAIQFDMPYEITNIWNGAISSYNEGTYVIKNAGHNQDISPGSSVSFGFSANTTDENIVYPDRYAIIGKEASAGSDRYEINFDVTSDWESAFNGQIVITNLSDEVIEDWALEFDFDQEITTFWTADIISHEGKHYVVKNKGYNANIEPGQSVTLGFSGRPGNVVSEPKDYTLNYIGID